jgi:hypothetical protein
MKVKRASTITSKVAFTVLIIRRSRFPNALVAVMADSGVSNVSVIHRYLGHIP